MESSWRNYAWFRLCVSQRNFAGSWIKQEPIKLHIDQMRQNTRCAIGQFSQPNNVRNKGIVSRFINAKKQGLYLNFDKNVKKDNCTFGLVHNSWPGFLLNSYSFVDFLKLVEEYKLLGCPLRFYHNFSCLSPIERTVKSGSP